MTKKNFKKIDLVDLICLNTGLSNNFSKKLVNDILYIMNKNISSGYLNLKNIGTFELVEKKQRLGRNPKTKEEYIISARKSIRFKAAKHLLNYLKKSYEKVS
mgnify:CR=1 FL=1